MSLPRHIAIIMDGNGRWAKKRMLPRNAGHRAGMKRVISLTDHAFSSGVKYLTLFALSTENLSRPEEELEALFELFREYFRNNTERLAENGVRMKILGDRALLPSDICALIGEGERKTQNGTRGTLCIALGYGARQELLAAVNRAVRGGKELNAEEFSALLYTAGIPEPDLLIRTGKEKRLSNFLLWQCAYTELYFSDKLFPAFTNADLDRAIKEFSERERRFGKL